MGFLYYGYYSLYYESGRAEAIRDLGFTYKQIEEMGIVMPVIELHSQYFRPARYDDLLTVKTTLKELPQDANIQFHTTIYNEKGQLLNKGVTKLVFYDPKARKKVPMPFQLLEKLMPFFNKK
jgi:acyl-CoA thioester hydrolase